jgi:S-methylmethionine-dependent homocysteine/selenocysteine methylase
MKRFALFVGLSFSMFTIAPAIGADKFECPSLFKPNTPAKLEQVKGMLPTTNALPDINQLNVTIATLRREGMSKRLIVDHLIGAYCPTVAQQTSLSEAEKAARVARFSGQVTRLVYSLESGLDVLINVPLTPDIVEAVTDVAKKQGLTGPAWIAMTIDDALQQQSMAQRK